MDILRFVDGAGAERLNLINPTGWFAGAEFNLGRKVKTRIMINQPGVDGDTLATHSRDTRTLILPLYMKPQANITNMLNLYGALVTEVERDTNILEVRPPGFGSSFLIDTYAGDVDALLHGGDLPDVLNRLKTGSPLIVTLPRAPESRGAGTFL